MYLVMQSFPEEKIVFASSSEKEANDYFDLQVQHGNGWFELWQEGSEIPCQVGGDQFYAPYSSVSAAIHNNRFSPNAEKFQGQKKHPVFTSDKHQLILTSWE